MSQKNLVHKHFRMHQAMKISDAKAAVDKTRDELKNLRAWQESTSSEQTRGDQ